MKTLLPLALLLLASSALAQPSGREELRTALGDYYAHVVTERLELGDKQAGKLRPLLDEVVSAQQEGQVTSRSLQRRLSKALKEQPPAPETVRPLVFELLDTEADLHARMSAARRNLLAELDPRQQARFLLSEGEYRQAVLQHIRELRGGGAPGPDRADSPWMRERAQREQAPRTERSPEEEAARRTDLRENLTLLLAFQLRNAGGLSLDRVVDLLPRLEESVGAQLDLAELESGAKRELQASLESDASKSELKDRIAALLDAQEEQFRRLAEARRAVAGSLEPVAAARFLHLQDRFRKDAPRKLRMMQRLMADEGGDAGPSRDGRREQFRRMREKRGGR